MQTIIIHLRTVSKKMIGMSIINISY